MTRLRPRPRSRHDGRVVRLDPPRLADRVDRAASALALVVAIVFALALLFPIVHRNDADIDFGGQRAGLCRAGARAQHRGRLRRAARPRLRRVFRDRRLCLRHRRLVAGDAGMVELLGDLPVARPRRALSRDGRRRRAFPGVVLADDAGCRGADRVFRRAVRRADAAPQGRLPGDRHPRLRRDRADRRAQHAERHQRRAWA